METIPLLCFTSACSGRVTPDSLEWQLFTQEGTGSINMDSSVWLFIISWEFRHAEFLDNDFDAVLSQALCVDITGGALPARSCYKEAFYTTKIPGAETGWRCKC